MKNYWISWYGHPSTGFGLHSPWWISGERMDGARTICAAVRAESADDAKRTIIEAHDAPVELEWRFCTEQPAEWSPFSGRFPRAAWMRWPAMPKGLK